MTAGTHAAPEGPRPGDNATRDNLVLPHDVPSVTVVIITWNRPRYVADCLDHLAAMPRRPAQVLVVDASRTGDTAKVVAERSWATYISFPGGAGHMTRSRNHALLYAQGDIIAFIDDDANVRPGWLGAILEAFRDPSVAALAGRTCNGQPEEEAEGVESIGRLNEDGQLTGNFAADPGRLIEVDHGIGANMSFRREILARLGGFRDNFPGTALREDTDMFLRVRALGGRTVFTPWATVDHVAAPHEKGQRFDWRYQFWGVHNHVLLLAWNFKLYSPITRQWIAGESRRSLKPGRATIFGGPLHVIVRLAGLVAGILSAILSAQGRHVSVIREGLAADRIRAALQSRIPIHESPDVE